MWSLKYYFIIKRSNFSIMIFDLVSESGNFGEVLINIILPLLQLLYCLHYTFASTLCWLGSAQYTQYTPHSVFTTKARRVSEEYYREDWLRFQ